MPTPVCITFHPCKTYPSSPQHSAVGTLSAITACNCAPPAPAREPRKQRAPGHHESVSESIPAPVSLMPPKISDFHPSAQPILTPTR
ncbi:hypothetical protein C8Q79DRAFT_936059 [Trametes meyenii]|nr:hypothetical protein C8Q79DRAFT_936059 [Trametes meyenii]